MENSKKYSIFADINSSSIFVGTLFVDINKNKEVYSFQFDESYLALGKNYIIDPELDFVSYRQYKNNPNELYGFLKDAMPDRWGKKLLEKVHKRKLYGSDYLTLINDLTRQGAIRIKENDTFLMQSVKPIPSFLYLNKLEQASLNIEDDLDDDLSLLFEPGSSLGGARPKANVYDNDENLYIAKFPSKKDDYDVEKIECIVTDLAALMGIKVSPHKLVQFSNYGSTLISKRFDRKQKERYPYVSMMTLLQADDGLSNEYSYQDLLKVIAHYSSKPKEDSLELYKRLIFNILIHNNDDHLRNHGFIFINHGWELSPVFDLNPSFYNSSLTLSIDGNDYSFSFESAIKCSKYFGINEQDALSMVNNFKLIASKNVLQLCEKYALANKEKQKLLNLLTSQ